MLIETTYHRPESSFVWSGYRPPAGVSIDVGEPRERPTLATVPAGVVLLQLEGLTWKRRVKRLAENVSRVAASSAVKRVMIQLESAGGPWSGLSDAWRTIHAAAKSKPIWAFADDVLLGTGVYLASACSRVVANAECRIGDVGTFAALHDHTRRYAADGVDVHLVRAGAPLKGQGVKGTAITAELIAETRHIVDTYNGEFLRGLQHGRGLTAKQAAAVNTGATWFAREAKRLGLIDDIATLDDALAMLAKSTSASQSSPKPKPAAAAAVPSSKPIAASTPSLAPTAPKLSHIPPKSAATEWRELIAKIANDENCDRATATRLLVRRNPQLHQRFIEEANGRS